MQREGFFDTSPLTAQVTDLGDVSVGALRIAFIEIRKYVGVRVAGSPWRRPKPTFHESDSEDRRVNYSSADAIESTRHELHGHECFRWKWAFERLGSIR